MEKEGTEYVKEMAVSARIQWGFLVGLWVCTRNWVCEAESPTCPGRPI